MHFNKLTDDMHSLVLKRAIAATSQRLGWESCLGLLSVCSRWRHLALPLVYRRVWINHDIRKLRTASNASLIAKQSYQTYANQLYINMYVNEVLPTLRTVLTLLEDNGKQWPSVRTLHLYISCNPLGSRLDGLSVSEYKDALGGTIRKLVRVLPNVEILNLNGQDINRRNLDVLVRFGKAYSKQASSIACSHPTALMGQTYFENLTNLNITFTHTRRDMNLKICPDNLKYLTLCNVPDGFSWGCFSKQNCPQDAVFPQLEQLKFTYNNYAGYARSNSHVRNNCTLHFPKLKQLRTSSLYSTFPVLDKGVFGLDIEYLHLYDGDGALNSLAQNTLPSIKTMSIHSIQRHRENPHHCFDMLNRAQPITNFMLHSKLEIVGPGYFSVPDHFQCLALTHLSVKTNIYADAVSNIISNLPNLVELEILEFASNNTMPDSKDIVVSGIKPFNSKLGILTFAYDNKLCSRENAMRFLQYLMLRLPHLYRVTAKYFHKSKLASFIGSYKDQYPHLSQISLSFMKSNALCPLLIKN